MSKPKKTNMPKPSERDLLDAVEHANNGAAGLPFFLNDFSLRFLGNLSVEQLEQYDDVGSWLDLDKEDFKNLNDLQKLQSLKDFRGVEWSTRASKWLKNGIPPIVVITAPDEDGMHTQIGDGRGRVNFANIFNKQIPTWHLIYKKKKQKQLENIVYQCIEEIFNKDKSK